MGSTYIGGVRLIRGEPMTRAEYHAARGLEAPPPESPADAGYKVERLDDDPHDYPAWTGYEHWMPAELFARVYRDVTLGMSFGDALVMLKAGRRVARRGWNGKGMWLSLSGFGLRAVPAAGFWSENNRRFAEQQGGQAVVLPCLTLKTATGEILMGWTPNALDLLAEDWLVLAPDAP